MVQEILSSGAIMIYLELFIALNDIFPDNSTPILLGEVKLKDQRAEDWNFDQSR